MKYFKYLWYVLKHKYYVGLACFKLGLWKEAITHDLSKIFPSEFFPYVNYFYGKYPEKLTVYEELYCWELPTKDIVERKFDFAWLLHQKRNNHHWQYWVLLEDSGNIKTFDMPSRVVIHVLCDWWGAGKALKSNLSVFDWFNQNSDKMQISNVTLSRILYFISQHKIFVEKRD